MTRILCVIPARGGSKRFPRKNIAKLNGKPLIAHTIEEAIASKKFDEIYVSTEDEEIASISEKFGANVHMRPHHLGADTATVPQVTLDLIEHLGKSGNEFDVVCILLPTSPLRRASHIIGAVDMFSNSDADYLMSTTEYHYSPFRALKENDDGFLEPFFGEKYLKRDQQNPHVVVHNGCIILAKVEAFRKDKTYYGERILNFPMRSEYSVDINEPFDLKLAECLMKKDK
jgi:CMP-N-acetylneuraminic acid synthetase